jgi:hypothetical protein
VAPQPQIVLCSATHSLESTPPDNCGVPHLRIAVSRSIYKKPSSSNITYTILHLTSPSPINIHMRSGPEAELIWVEGPEAVVLFPGEKETPFAQICIP